MIRKPWTDNKWLLTRQQEHARVAGVMAAAWRFPSERPSEQVFVAVSRHDDGWEPADALPCVAAAGCPMDFLEIPVTDAVGLWRRSVEALYEEKRYYAARLVAGHFAALTRKGVNLAKASPKSVVAAGKFLGDMAAMDRDCVRLAAVSPSCSADGSSFEADLRLLQVCDLLSLLLCGEFAGDQEIDDVPYLESGSRLRVSRSGEKLAMTVAPFPFRKNLRDHLAAYIIPRRVYETNDELRATLGDTSSKTIEFHVGGGG